MLHTKAISKECKEGGEHRAREGLAPPVLSLNRLNQDSPDSWEEKSSLLLLRFRVTGCTKTDGQIQTHVPSPFIHSSKASEVMKSDLLAWTSEHTEQSGANAA